MVLKEVVDQAIVVRTSQQRIIFVLFIRGFWCKDIDSRGGAVTTKAYA